MALHHNPRIVTEGLIFYLDAADINCYPGSGTTATDLTGNGNDGTLYNSPGYASDNKGAWVFDATNNYIGIANPSYPVAYTDPFTLGVWAYIPSGATWYNAGSGTAIIGRGSYGGSLGIMRRSTNNEIYAAVRINSNVAGPLGVAATIGRDAWYSLVYTWNGSDVVLYVNGALVSSYTVNADTNFGQTDYIFAGNVAFGGSGGGYGEGTYTGAHLYNRALSADEIEQNYEAQKTRFGL
jgi:hypothetical protein